MLKKNIYATAIQILAGFFLFALPLLIFFERDQVLNPSLILKYLLFCALFIAIYIFHTNLLFPKFYSKNRYLPYFGFLGIILIVILAIRPFDEFMVSPKPPMPSQIQGKFPSSPPEKHGPVIDVVSAFLFLLVIIIGIAIETNKQLRLTMQRALQAEKDQAQAELSFLKAQVNPHFLFNILNNIYTLSITKDEYTSESIMKLSNMMRYITDEAGEDFVALGNEINCITDYIDLQRLRITNETQINYELSGAADDKKIAPLILMAFVENVFKYGISNHKKSKLDIKISINADTLNFYCQNPIHQGKTVAKRTGIGLENTKKRLNFIYPERHLLVIEHDDKAFKVNLTVYL